MDNGTPVVLEKLERGAILGAYMFLVNDDIKITATCTTACRIFVLDRKVFTQLVVRDTSLLAKLIVIID